MGVLGGAGCPMGDDVLQAGGSHEGLLMVIKCSLWPKGALFHLEIKFQELFCWRCEQLRALK